MGCIILLLYYYIVLYIIILCMYFFTAFNNILLYYIFLQYFWVAFNGLIFLFIYLFYFLPFWQEIKKKKNQSEVSGPTQEYRIIIIIIYPCLFGVVCKDICIDCLSWVYLFIFTCHLFFFSQSMEISQERKKNFRVSFYHIIFLIW